MSATFVLFSLLIVSSVNRVTCQHCGGCDLIESRQRRHDAGRDGSSPRRCGTDVGDEALGESLRGLGILAGVQVAVDDDGGATAAPYRHFADRDALLSAVAAVGYRQLATELAAAHPQPKTPDDLADIEIAYVQFALTRPGLFRAMFAEPCDPTTPERVAAVAAIQEYLNSIVRHALPFTDPEAMATAVWALVHGLAFLHLDGKYDTSSDEVVAEKVRTAVRAMLAAPATRRAAPTADS